MMYTPKFTIVMPVYNASRYLLESIESLVSQNETDWELICVDDSSTDGSVDILSAYAESDARVVVVKNEGRGVASARNTALKYARGEWVGALDSDDKVSPDWLEKASVAILENPSADLIRLSFNFWDPTREAGKQTWGCRLDFSEKTMSGTQEVMSWGWRELINGGWLWLMFIRKDVITRSGCSFNSHITMKEDVVFDMGLLPYVREVVQLSYQGYFYRRHSESICVKQRVTESSVSLIYAYRELWENNRVQAKKLGITEDVQRGLSMNAWDEVRWWCYTHGRNEVESSRRMAIAFSSFVRSGGFSLRSLTPRCLLPYFFLAFIGILIRHSLGPFYTMAWLINISFGLKKAILGSKN